MQLSGLQLLGKMGRFERPSRLAPTSAGSRARARCSLGMTCVCRGPGASAAGAAQGQRAGAASLAPFTCCHLCVQNSLETREVLCLPG